MGSTPSAEPTAPRPPGWGAGLAIGLVRVYQRWLSPLLPPLCRFEPTCSQYTLEALQRYGLVRGLWLGARRILRCNPFFPGGPDPVP